MQLPLTGQRLRIKQEQAACARVGFSPRRHQPPEAIVLEDGCVHESAFHQSCFALPFGWEVAATVQINRIGAERLGNHKEVVASAEYMRIRIVLSVAWNASLRRE